MSRGSMPKSECPGLRIHPYEGLPVLEYFEVEPFIEEDKSS